MAKLTTKQKQHKAMCSICKSEHCSEIEELYLDGTSPYQIELDYPGVSHQAVYKHAEIFGLDKRRDNSSLKKVRRLIDRANGARVKIDGPMLVKLIELEAKLTGQLIERRENKNTNKTEIDVSKSVQRRIDRLIDAVPGLRERIGDADADK